MAVYFSIKIFHSQLWKIKFVAKNLIFLKLKVLLELSIIVEIEC